MPEPVDEPTQRLDLVIWRLRRPRGRSPGQDALLIEQDPSWPSIEGPAVALATECQLALRAIGEDEEHHARRVEVFEEQRLTEPPDKRGTPIYKLVVSLIGDEQGEIQVG